MRTSRKPRFVLIFLLVLCALFIYGYTSRMDELAGLQAEMVAIQSRIDHAKQEQTKLVDERAYVTSPEYLNRTAREDFDMGKPGDRLVVPIPPEGGTSVTGGMAVAAASVPETTALAFDPHDLPVWQQWVTFFTDTRPTGARQVR
jgi:hypothetical protein